MRNHPWHKEKLHLLKIEALMVGLINGWTDSEEHRQRIWDEKCRQYGQGEKTSFVRRNNRKEKETKFSNTEEAEEKELEVPTM